VRNDARKRARQAEDPEDPQPIDKPPDRLEAAPATATNGRLPARKHVLLNRADASNADPVVVRRWRQNPVGARDAAPAQWVKDPVPEDAPVASVEPDPPNFPATTAGDVPGLVPAAPPVMPADNVPGLVPAAPPVMPADNVPGLVPAAPPVMPADNRTPRGPGDANIAATDFELALGLHERGELEAAAVAYRRAELGGEPEAAFNLGLLLYEAGDLPGAEDAWRRCLSYEHARAATNLGFLLEERGDLQKALLAYSAADRWGDPEGRRLGAALLRTAKGLPPVGP
jgi:hypothetical protein